jgi:hypothetical protein
LKIIAVITYSWLCDCALVSIVFFLQLGAQCGSDVFLVIYRHRYGDIVPVTNAGQIMSIILMLMGSFYLAMPLTAAASTFYTVHQIYNEKKTKTASQDKKAAALQAAQRKTSLKDVLAAAAAANATAEATVALPASAPAVIYGDFLDKKLQKRVNLLLGELFLLQSALQDFYQDLHKTSTDYTSEDNGGLDNNHQSKSNSAGRKTEGFVEVNNRKVPILQRLRGAGVNSAKGVEPGRENKSDLLQQLQGIVSKLDGLLTGAEEDILRIVVLHHKLRKNF